MKHIHRFHGLGHEHLWGTIILPTLEGEVFRSFGPIQMGNSFTNYLQINDI